MSASAAGRIDSAQNPREARRVLILLMLSVAINYIDRGALSVSAPLLSRELALSPVQLGLLFSGFFWSYSMLQPLAGWLVDRYDVTRLFGAGYLLWSLATGSMAWIHRFSVLFGARLVLGAGESVAYPAYSKILVQYFPENRRGVANSMLEAAAKMGPAISTLIGGLLVARFGWRALFLCLGVVSLLWLVPWAVWGPSSDAGSKGRESKRISLTRIMSRREAWGTSLGMFALGYVWSFLLSWLPMYMVNERGFSMRMAAILGSMPFWAMAGTSAAGGWLSDRWIRAGGSVTTVRKTFMNAGLILCGATLLPAAAVHDATAAMVLLIISSAALGLFTSNVWAVTQTLAGPQAAGSWTGIQNAIGNLGGVLAPYLTGIIVGRTGSYYLAFAACSVVILTAVASYATLVKELKPLDWEISPLESLMLFGPQNGFIDAHVHLWTNDFSKYPLAQGFKPSDMAPRRFVAGDILTQAQRNEVERVVLVQMSYYGFDNSLMLDSIAQYPGRFRGIAVIDAEQPEVSATMKRLAKAGVRGFRIVAIDAGTSPLESTGLQRMFAAGAQNNLAMCFLTSPDMLPGVDSLCAKFPHTPVVIDHMARIGMTGAIQSRDIDALCRLARHRNTMVKVSAFYALGRKRPPHDELMPLIHRLYSVFGPSRLMWASDSPFQLAAETYRDSITLIRDRLPFLTNADKDQMLRRTAESLFFQ